MRLIHAFSGLMLISLALFISCKPSTPKDSFSSTDTSGEPSEIIDYNNPPAEGFNFEASSPHAIVMADKIMHAMGGRDAWDKTEVISWNFLGIRTLLWDKANNRVRIDIPSENKVVTLNMDEMNGKAWENGEEITGDDLTEQLKWAKSAWINDSYWLFMPFKLKDSGVTLTYVKEDTTLTGIRSDVLQLTFENVGDTPQNKYEIWVDIEDKLIKQWAFYREASQAEPSFVKPWTEYKDYDGLLLAGERGDRDITDIKVLKKVPKGAFESAGELSL